MTERSFPAVQRLLWERQGENPTLLKGNDYRRRVFACIDHEDTPRPLVWQLDLLREAGFSGVEILHKSNCFVAFGAVKR